MLLLRLLLLLPVLGLVFFASPAHAEKGGAKGKSYSYERLRASGFVMTHPTMRMEFFEAYQNHLNKFSVSEAREVGKLRDNLDTLIKAEQEARDFSKANPSNTEARQKYEALSEQIGSLISPHLSKANQFIFSNGALLKSLKSSVEKSPADSEMFTKVMFNGFGEGKISEGKVVADANSNASTIAGNAGVKTADVEKFISVNSKRISDSDLHSAQYADAIKVMDKTASAVSHFRGGGDFEIPQTNSKGKVEMVRVKGETDKESKEIASRIFKRGIDMNDPQSLELLEQVLKNPSKELRKEALKGIDRITETLEKKYNEAYAAKKKEIENAKEAKNSKKEAEILEDVEKKAATDALSDLEEKITKDWMKKYNGKLTKDQEGHLKKLLNVLSCNCMSGLKKGVPSGTCSTGIGGGGAPSKGGGSHNRGWLPPELRQLRIFPGGRVTQAFPSGGVYAKASMGTRYNPGDYLFSRRRLRLG